MFTKALTLILLCSLAVPLAAAAKGSTGEPLLMRNVSAKGSMVQFDVSNVSAKDVRAYVVACRLTGTDGKASGGVMSLTAVVGLTPLPSVPRSLAAGATFHAHIGGVPRNSRGVYGSCRPTMDYVLFTDGSSWGPDTLKDSLKVRGIIEGYNEEAMALRDLVSQGSTSTVLQYLRDFKPL